MRLMTLAAAGTLALAGCGGWAKPGATEAEFYQDRFACEQQTAAMYPVVMASAGGGYQAPAQTRCTAIGNQMSCTTTPGAYTPPPQSDQNVLPRAMAFNSCMQSRGYTFKTGR